MTDGLTFYDISTQENTLLERIPLRGRKQELRQILKTLTLTKTGMSKALLITGSSGVGKSALLEATQTMANQWLGCRVLSLSASECFHATDVFCQMVWGLEDLSRRILTETLSQINATLGKYQHEAPVTLWGEQELLAVVANVVLLGSMVRSRRELTPEAIMRSVRNSLGGSLVLPRLKESDQSMLAGLLASPWLSLSASFLQPSHETIVTAYQLASALCSPLTDAVAPPAPTEALLSETLVNLFLYVAQQIHAADRCLVVTLDDWDSLRFIPEKDRESIKQCVHGILKRLAEEKHLPILWVIACRSEGESETLAGPLFSELRQKMLIGPLNEIGRQALLDYLEKSLQLPLSSNSKALLLSMCQGSPYWLQTITHHVHHQLADVLLPEEATDDRAETSDDVGNNRMADTLNHSLVSRILPDAAGAVFESAWDRLVQNAHLPETTVATLLSPLPERFGNHCFTQRDLFLWWQRLNPALTESGCHMLLMGLQEAAFVVRSSRPLTFQSVKSEDGLAAFRLTNTGVEQFFASLARQSNAVSVSSGGPLRPNALPGFAFGNASSHTLTPYETLVAMSSLQPQDLDPDNAMPNPVSDFPGFCDYWLASLEESLTEHLMGVPAQQREAIIDTLTRDPEKQQLLFDRLASHLTGETNAMDRLSACKLLESWLSNVKRHAPNHAPSASQQCGELVFKLYGQVEDLERGALLEFFLSHPDAFLGLFHHAGELETRLKPMFTFTGNEEARALLWLVTLRAWQLAIQQASQRQATLLGDEKTGQKLLTWLLQDPSPHVQLRGAKMLHQSIRQATVSHRQLLLSPHHETLTQWSQQPNPHLRAIGLSLLFMSGNPLRHHDESILTSWMRAVPATVENIETLFYRPTDEPFSALLLQWLISLLHDEAAATEVKESGLFALQQSFYWQSQDTEPLSVERVIHWNQAKQYSLLWLGLQAIGAFATRSETLQALKTLPVANPLMPNHVLRRLQQVCQNLEQRIQPGQPTASQPTATPATEVPQPV